MTMPTPDINESALPRLSVAVCQVETTSWDVEGNTERTLNALRSAAKKGAKLAITPECVIQGYPPPIDDESRARLRELAEPVDGERIAQIRDVAREAGMRIVVGFAERGEAGDIHNAAAFIDAEGEVRSVYRKVHCRPFEDLNHQGLYEPGEAFSVEECPVDNVTYQVGTYICFDREIPESTRCLRALGAELIVCPLATNTSRLDTPLSRADNEVITRVRAAENEVFIAVVNHAGLYNGGSFIVGPSGEVIIQMDKKPGIEVVDLPLGILREKFHSDPLGWAGWGYRRPDLYERYIKK
jgi:predicted amidohydrolase